MTTPISFWPSLLPNETAITSDTSICPRWNQTFTPGAADRNNQ
ncbi:MAG: hypothetical protein R3E39_24945 [Anaerolineae bacterium]